MPASAPPPRVVIFGSPRLRTVLTLGLWAVGVGLGFRALVEYEVTPGTGAQAPAAWPADLGLPLDPHRTNLVLFAHPQCPCTRATIHELAAIMTRCPQEIRATVCFIDLEGEPPEWTHSSLWQAANAIPGVQVIADRDGRIAAHFGSVTSGQVLLFDGAGRQQFSGGITGARGHEGDNLGRQAVIALARGELCTTSLTSVYGCSLRDKPITTAANP